MTSEPRPSHERAEPSAADFPPTEGSVSSVKLRNLSRDARERRAHLPRHALRARLCYQKMSSARMSRGETLVLVMQPAQDRPTHDLALAPGR